MTALDCADPEMPLHRMSEQSRPRRTVPPAVLWLLVSITAIAAIYGGVALRKWFFDVTEPIHFRNDNTRNWTWGYYTYANMAWHGRSFLDTYDDVGIQDRQGRLWIDYAPGRLAVYTAWAWWNNTRSVDDARLQRELLDGAYHSDRAFYQFFFWFNFAVEIFTAIGMFLLVRQVLQQAGASALRATIVPLIAGLLAMLNPASIISAYGWPSGDSWVVPGFIWAVYFARIDRWFWAGVTLAIGAMFKGQILFVAPLLVLWPLFQLRWRAPLLLLAGAIGTFGLLTCGWTLSNVDAAHVRSLNTSALLLAIVPAIVVIALSLARPMIWRRVRRQTPLIVYLIAAAMTLLPLVAVLWPAWFFAGDLLGSNAGWLTPGRLSYALLLPLAMAAVTGVFFVPRRWLAFVAVFLIGGGALVSMRIFNTSYAWFDASYGFGTNHWPKMVMGFTSNIPGILSRYYGWDNFSGPSQTVFTLMGSAITMKTLMLSIFAFTMLLTAIGIAIQDARQSPAFLVAIVTPWMLFFTIPCQIHERYLLFAAWTACICIGHSVGMTLLGLLASLLTFAMTLHVMLVNRAPTRVWNRQLYQWYPEWFDPHTRFGFDLLRWISGTFPDIGWAVILATLIFLYITLRPGRRGVTRNLSNISTPGLTYSGDPGSAAVDLPEADRPSTAGTERRGYSESDETLPPTTASDTPPRTFVRPL